MHLKFKKKSKISLPDPLGFPHWVREPRDGGKQWEVLLLQVTFKKSERAKGSSPEEKLLYVWFLSKLPIPILGLEPKFQVNWTTLRCSTGSVVNQLHLKCFRTCVFWETPSHSKDVWKIAKPPKYCFSFSKQRNAENNNFFTIVDLFFPASTLKKFQGVCVSKKNFLAANYLNFNFCLGQ